MTLLTICSASYNSKPYLDLNCKLISERFTGFTWLVSQNGQQEKLAAPIISYPEVPKGVPRDDAPMIHEASYQHATAINFLLPKVTTRFVLILDPDFFIVPSLGSVIGYMLENQLSVLGAPYHPKSKKHYKYFPTAFCMFLDLERVDRKKLDFTPGFGAHKPIPGIGPDTGYKVYQELKDSPHLTVLPVCTENTDYEAEKYSNKPFRSKGLYDALGLGWEEYYMNGKPFAVHTHMKLHGKQKHWTKNVFQEFLTNQPKQIETCIRNLRQYE